MMRSTTGPLGQGLSNAVGLALAEKLLGDEFNRPGHSVVDHHSCVFLGDGLALLAPKLPEVQLAMAAQQMPDAQQCPVRVVSIPSSTVFDRQDAAFGDTVLGGALPRFGVEAGVTRWWGQYGCRAALGIDSFGESAPAPEVFAHFGLTAAALAEPVPNNRG